MKVSADIATEVIRIGEYRRVVKDLYLKWWQIEDCSLF